jgi:anti-sigma factor RsiW
MTRTHVSEQDLHAYIDAELSDGGRREIEAALAEDENLRLHMEAFRTDKTSLSQLYAALLDEPVPSRWIDLVEKQPARARPIFSRGVLMAVAATILLVIGGVVMYREALPGEEPIIEEALAARSNAIAAQQVVPVTSTDAVSRVNVVVASALRMHVRAPDLSSMGYRLDAVRVYQDVPGGKAIELLYRHGDNGVFALYLRRPSGEARFDQFKRGELRVCIWQDDVLGTVMTGEMSAAEMQRLASLAYTGLES